MSLEAAGYLILLFLIGLRFWEGSRESDTERDSEGSDEGRTPSDG